MRLRRLVVATAVALAALVGTAGSASAVRGCVAIEQVDLGACLGV